jgi:hypothetical protein
MDVLNGQPQLPDVEQVFAYFLGELAAPESERFEEQVFEDEALAEHVFALEDELIELYLHNNLPPARRARFEQHYLTTAERRAKVEFAAAFEQELGAAAAPPPRAPETKAAWWQTLFVTPRLAWALLLLLAASAGWWWIARNRAPAPDEVAQTASPTPSASPSPTATISATPTVPLPRATPTALPRAGMVVALTLAPGLARGSGQALPILQLPEAAEAAELTLQLYRADFTRYRAVLQTGGATVWTKNASQARTTASGEAEVRVRIPAQHLKRGDFLLLLFGADRGDQTGSALVASYSFSVQPN